MLISTINSNEKINYNFNLASKTKRVYYHESDYIYKSEENIYKPFLARTKWDSLIMQKEKIGIMRHYPAAAKEWKNSVYAYNKKSLRNVSARDDMAKKLIKSYFYLSNNKTLARSKRMRSLRRKFTTKRIFVTKPELKQTNDKVTITVFTYNREKQFLIKKLFFFNRRRGFLNLWRNSNSLNSINYPLMEMKNVSLKKTIYTDKLISRNSGVTKQKIFKVMKNVIQQNKHIYNMFASSLVSENYKHKTYLKLAQKLVRNINVSKIDNLTYNLNKSDKDFYYTANRSNINIHKRKNKRMFRKNRVTTVKPWYVRKKMKHYVAEPAKLSRFERSKIRKRVIPFSGIKLKNEMNFLSFKMLLRNKRFAYARKLFYYYFLKYVLSMFNIKVYAFKQSNLPSKKTMKDVLYTSELINIEKQMKLERKGKRNKKNKFTYNIPKKTLPLYNAPLTLTPDGTKVLVYFYSLKRKVKAIKRIKKYRSNLDVNEILTQTKPVVISLNVLQNKNKLDNLDYVLSNVNFVITEFLNKMLIKSDILEKERKLNILFQNFSKRHYLRFISKLWTDKTLFSNNYTKLMINRFKFSKFLPGLKLLIGKIYNKKTELNIVNLKYSHLNTDIFTDIISLKLRKKLALGSVLGKALKLVKRPSDYKDVNRIHVDYDISKLSNLNIYKSLKFKALNQMNKIDNLSLQDILKRIYPRPLVNTGFMTDNIKTWRNIRVITSKLSNILKTVKYKTLAGVRIEAAGRLTRRYTASRALFKFKYKGGLKDIDYSRKAEQLKKSMATVMLRNHAKANSQYSVASSRRRVGAFGIKGWISGY